MSILILRGHPALSRRYGSVCSSCLEHLHHSRQRQHPIPISRRGYVDWKNIEHPEWRKEAVKRINTRNPEAAEALSQSYTPDPRTRDGFMTPTAYMKTPTFTPISLDPVPNVTPDDFDESYRNLDSTRPAALEQVTREIEEPAYKYYYRLGRSYLTFYKIGVKNIRRNWREFSNLKGWLNPFTLGGAARYGGTEHTTRSKQKIPIPHISRRDYIFYYRTRHDLFKLLPFGLILLVCGEFTPLVILALGNRVTPYTCRIPSQQRQSLDDALTRFRTYMREMRRLTKLSVPDPKHTFDFYPPGHKREHKWRRDALFGHLANQTSFSTLPFPLMANAYWHFRLQKRLTAYWDSIFCDNILIRRGGGFSSLSPQDIFDYALNYGSFTLLIIMQYQIKHHQNYDFINDDLKNRLVPILEAEADVIFDDDFTRLPPGMHWARAYRDSSRWGKHTPDIEAALELMREFRMEWSTDKEEWGGGWKFNTDAKAIESGESEKTQGKADGRAKKQKKVPQTQAPVEGKLDKADDAVHAGADRQRQRQRQSQQRRDEDVDAEEVPEKQKMRM